LLQLRHLFVSYTATDVPEGRAEIRHQVKRVRVRPALCGQLCLEYSVELGQ